MSASTTVLCDAYFGKGSLQVAEPVLQRFGKTACFSGVITTVKCFEDNARIKTILAEPGEGRVLVVDGGGSRRCALLGSAIARQAADKGWHGVVVYGCVREVALLAELPVGILALHPHPVLCHGKDSGDRDVQVSFAGIQFRKDHFLYADYDGMVVSEARLS